MLFPKLSSPSPRERIVRAAVACERCARLAATKRQFHLSARLALKDLATDYSLLAFELAHSMRQAPIRPRDLWPFAIAPAVALCLYVAHVMGWAG